MTKRMLIDASHPEETRVVVLDGDQLENFDFENASKSQIKSNIYLAKVTRVEPSLQAAFVEYGGNRHGFLAFAEIHPDYFQIPQADRALLSDVEEDVEEGDDDDDLDDDEDGAVSAERARKRARLLRSYKIQEVIKRRQILLVQVVKEERGNKGAALTTYLSLAGRYGVLMPNTPRGGGISRKINDPEDRRRLKSVVQQLDVPKGMGLIVRTAGAERTRAEIRRDYEYLLRLWNDIRERTLRSVAPCLIHEEADIVKRAIRDLYTREIEEVLVEGETGYREAKRFMGMLMPSRARYIKQYKATSPLFQRHAVEDKLDSMYDAQVRLRSGGSIVIHATEALTAVDVNSGRSTKERHIEETAYKTNLEAADEVARQIRLRDIAGLIVIDFIDMSDGRSQRKVEQRLRDAMKSDRARVQIGKISSFGLLELSRQRLRPSFQELSAATCPHCQGSGFVPSVENAALRALRLIEQHGGKGDVAVLGLSLPVEVALYLLNQKRHRMLELEQRFDFAVRVTLDERLMPGQCEVQRLEMREAVLPDEETVEAQGKTADAEPVSEVVEAKDDAGADGEEEESARNRRGRGRRRRRKRRDDATENTLPIQAEADSSADEAIAEDNEVMADADAEALPARETSDADEDKPGRRRRRRSGRGRGRRRQNEEVVANYTADDPASTEQPRVEFDPQAYPLEQPVAEADVANSPEQQQAAEGGSSAPNDDAPSVVEPLVLPVHDDSPSMLAADEADDDPVAITSADGEQAPLAELDEPSGLPINPEQIDQGGAVEQPIRGDEDPAADQPVAIVSLVTELDPDAQPDDEAGQDNAVSETSDVPEPEGGVTAPEDTSVLGEGGDASTIDDAGGGMPVSGNDATDPVSAFETSSKENAHAETVAHAHNGAYSDRGHEEISEARHDQSEADPTAEPAFADNEENSEPRRGWWSRWVK